MSIINSQMYLKDGGSGGGTNSVSVVDKLIAIARAEIGYLEKASNSQLDDKTANAGRNNWTKYARDLHAAGYYNGNKNGYAWCDVFVDWCFYQLCGKDAKVAQEVICQSGSYGAGCAYSRRYYKDIGRLYYKPQPGDQIFFYSTGDTVGHTGIVYKVDSDRVYTIEGNTSSAAGVVANGGGVFEKSYLLTSTKLAGYGRPRFDRVPGGGYVPTYDDDGTLQIPGTAPDVPTQSAEEVNNIIAKTSIDAVVSSISPTSATITIDSPNKKSRSYSITDIYNSFIQTEELAATGTKINLTDLEPGMVYLLKIKATGTSTQAERQLIFETPQEYPGPVENFNATFNNGSLLNKTCTIKFSAPTSVWGSYNYAERTKGYRVSLLINNKIAASNDALIRYSKASSKVSKTITLKDLVGSKGVKLDYGDTIQIGVQTWVKDDSDNLLLSEYGHVCSAPIYLKHSLSLVDNIYLKTSSGFQSAMLFMPHFTK